LAKNKTKTKKKKRNLFLSILSFFSTLLALVLIIVPLALCFLLYINSPVQTVNNRSSFSGIDGITEAEDGGYYIEVRRGETSQSVGMRLERAGLIRNRYFWNFLCRFQSEHIKTGTFRIDAPSSQISILRVLIAGKQELFRVTIPEGVTIRKAAAIFEEIGICPANEFIAAARDVSILNNYGIPVSSRVSVPSMEGYLFPDTYYFPKEYPAEKVVEKMADNFFTQINSISPAVQNMSPAELNRIVILASIIEREYRISDEAPIMSGVFTNRLRINMALQSCATVQYIITEIQGKPHPSVLLFTDLEIVNPYNTYMYPGLPPGPISAPGYVALRAAFYPQTTNYLYFRLTDAASGKHYFSRSYDEHIRAGTLYIKP